MSTPDRLELPRELNPRRLARRALEVVAFLVAVVLVVELAPGLGEVRQRLDGASPGWLALGVALEALSCGSYVLMFREVFCRQMSWRASWEIGLSELAVGSIVPASGAGGLALGAWILHESGMPGDQIGKRSVAFFLIKSSVNFVAVALIGGLMAIGIVGPHRTLLLTALPAALSVLLIAAILLLPRFGPGERPAPDAGRVRRGIGAVRRALMGGVAEAVRLVRTRDPYLIAGAIGYWIFDNAVLWAAFNAFGSSPPISIVLLAYLIGQLGGALPLPGGVGGIDGGLFGTFVAFGTPVADAAAGARLPADPVLAAAGSRRDRVPDAAARTQQAGPARPVLGTPGPGLAPLPPHHLIVSGTPPPMRLASHVMACVLSRTQPCETAVPSVPPMLLVPWRAI